MQERIDQSTEDYLEAMLILKEEKGYVRTADIAEKLEVTAPSVSYATKKLRERGLISVDKSGFINLTEEGAQRAEKIYEMHITLARYFESIGVSPETASADACKVEHCISDETFQAIKGLLKNE